MGAARVVRIVGKILLAAGALLVLVGFVGVAYFQGFFALRDMLSPFNVVGWLAVVIALAPGTALITIADHLERQRR